MKNNVMIIKREKNNMILFGTIYITSIQALGSPRIHWSQFILNNISKKIKKYNLLMSISITNI